MAPVKPMGVNTPTGTKPGVTGFEQEYNQTPTPAQDLNPDAVADPDALPDPQRADAPKARKTRKSKQRG